MERWCGFEAVGIEPQDWRPVRGWHRASHSTLSETQVAVVVLSWGTVLRSRAGYPTFTAGHARVGDADIVVRPKAARQSCRNARGSDLHPGSRSGISHSESPVSRLGPRWDTPLGSTEAGHLCGKKGSPNYRRTT